jgi:hypothetical protein
LSRRSEIKISDGSDIIRFVISFFERRVKREK